MTNSNSSISKHYHQLNSEQRGQIQALLDSGITSCSVIAREVGCHKSTISRGSVLQRDHNYLFYEHYYADTAQIYHDKRRKNCYKRYAVFLCFINDLKPNSMPLALMNLWASLSRLCQAIHAPAHLPFIAILIVVC